MKTDKKYNFSFILECLTAAVSQLRKERDDIDSDLRVTRDTKGIPGSPNIPFVIDERISESDVFVGDLTYVSYVETTTPNGTRTFMEMLLGRNRWQQEGQPSINVATERGQAKGQGDFGDQRLITVMNTEYGEASQLPFDLIQTRHPIQYRYGKKTKKADVDVIRKDLIKVLKKAIREILDTEHERQKTHFAPFLIWKNWTQMMDFRLPLETTDYIHSFFEMLREFYDKEKKIVRICGLSGIGKTRLIYESFNTLPDADKHFLGQVLFVDENLTEAKTFLSTVVNLKLANERKILIIDNCSLEVHNKICPIISTGECRLNVITVCGDPDENPKEYDSNTQTTKIILVNEKCKTLVDQLLQRSFPEFSAEDRTLLVDFSSGLSFIAKLMADNPDRGKHEPGTLTQEAVVRRLLGPLYTNEQSRAVMHACSLFSQLGFKDGIAAQLEAVAINEDMFNITLPLERPEDVPERRLSIFRETCRQLNERQLLEIRGRAYAFRPSPLAVRLAEDWWRTCTPAKFARIIPVLQDVQLVERFCEQFRYLRHVQNAQDIVAHLCRDFFSSAEVLDTEVGSRLFRSFVYVNPMVCAAALAKAFLPLTVEENKKLATGRRNLVWSLEKLCYGEDTFHPAIEVLVAFSVAENENYANNATGQFLQLFHIFLPGTRVNLYVRWEVIDQLYHREEKEYQSLSISAMASALTADHFHRSAGAEDIGEASPNLDYKPPQEEIRDYWHMILQKLLEHIVTGGEFRERAVAIIRDNFYALCSLGGGRIIMPIMRTLITDRFVEPMEARKQLQFVINSGRVFDPVILDELKAVYDTLKANGFEDMFKIYVGAPSSWEYHDEEDPYHPGGSLMKNLKELTKELLAEPESWDSRATLLFSGSIAEGFNFGRTIAQNAEPKLLGKFLNMAIEQIAAMRPEQRNIGIILGALSEKSSVPEAERIFELVLQNPDLKYLAFAIARVTELPNHLIIQLVSGAERGEIPIEWFLEFNYGWGIRHLPVTDIIDISMRLRNISTLGKFLALYNLATWITGKDDGLFTPFADLFREMIMRDSTAFFKHIRNPMDVHYYTGALSKLLLRTTDEELAKKAMDIILTESSEMEHYYSKEGDFYKILDVLQEKYFLILWEAVTKLYLNIGEYGVAAFHLKSLLGSRHDFQGQSDGLLFGGNAEKFATIFEWCKQHKDKEIYWIAELLPVFGGPRSSSSELHPYAKAFIDEFGDNSFVLGAIAAKMGTYGWMGTLIPKLESDKAIWTQLLDHPRASVRDWAKLHLEDVNKRIEFEKNREAEGL